MAASGDEPSDTIPPASKQPIPTPRLEEIAINACDSALQSVVEYEHPKTESWNSNIINDTLKALISDSSTPVQPPLYKFAVTSTIIQHIKPPPSQTGTNGTSQGAGSIGRRGMHSASGAYWNNEKDGMWHWKYTKGEEKGFDVVLSIIWISIA